MISATLVANSGSLWHLEAAANDAAGAIDHGEEAFFETPMHPVACQDLAGRGFLDLKVDAEVITHLEEAALQEQIDPGVLSLLAHLLERRRFATRRLEVGEEFLDSVGGQDVDFRRLGEVGNQHVG